MSGTKVVWTDLVRCSNCRTVNDARDEWCESCLADIPKDRANEMFVRRWSQRSRTSTRTVD